MRYPASEKLEVIRTVEASHLPVNKTLDMLCISRTTFYRWYDLYLDGGLDGLADRSPSPGLVLNRIPEAKRNDLSVMTVKYTTTSIMKDIFKTHRLINKTQCRSH